MDIDAGAAGCGITGYTAIFEIKDPGYGRPRIGRRANNAYTAAVCRCVAVRWRITAYCAAGHSKAGGLVDYNYPSAAGAGRVAADHTVFHNKIARALYAHTSAAAIGSCAAGGIVPDHPAPQVEGAAGYLHAAALGGVGCGVVIDLPGIHGESAGIDLYAAAAWLIVVADYGGLMSGVVPAGLCIYSRLPRYRI